MIKKILILFILTTALSSFAQNIRGILTSDVNVRWEPSVNAKKIKVYPKGKEIIVLQKKGRWSFIQNTTDNTKGWVSSKYIQTNKGILTSNANVRWSPSRNSGIIKVYPKGKEIIILQRKESWLFIQNPIDGTKGWVHRSLISKGTNTVTKVNNTVTKVSNTVPNCDCKITSPSNGDKDVNIKPTVIRWKAATGSPKPVGYYFSIGSEINGKMTYVKSKVNVLKNLNIGNVTSFSIPDLKPNTKYYIGLIPYNNIGLADCQGLFSFTTGSRTGSNTNSDSSSEQIIEKRLTNMGILWKWRNFNKTNLKSISMNNTERKYFVDEVLSWKDVPYKFGGTTRGGVDCSGLIWRGLRQAINYNGEKLNGQGWAQSGKLIANKSELIKGDLVCFSNIPGGSNRLVQHIAIYIGNGKFWHAPSSGKSVSEARLENSYWKPKFIFGVRY